MELKKKKATNNNLYCISCTNSLCRTYSHSLQIHLYFSSRKKFIYLIPRTIVYAYPGAIATEQSCTMYTKYRLKKIPENPACQ